MGIQVHLDDYQSSAFCALHHLFTARGHLMVLQSLSYGPLLALFSNNAECAFVLTDKTMSNPQDQNI